MLNSDYLLVYEVMSNSSKSPAPFNPHTLYAPLPLGNYFSSSLSLLDYHHQKDTPTKENNHHSASLPKLKDSCLTSLNTLYLTNHLSGSSKGKVKGGNELFFNQ